jgi:type II secretory pathway component PulJ
MSDDGYTMTDTLVALAILGLAISGLTVGLGVLARLQWMTEGSTADARAIARASGLLDQLLAAAGPFSNRDQRFQGEADQFSFECQQPQPCRGQLDATGQQTRLTVWGSDGVERRVAFRGNNALRFAYFGSQTEGPLWPQVTDQRQRLQGLAIVDTTHDRTVATAKLWKDQPAVCEFDVISQECR